LENATDTRSNGSAADDNVIARPDKYLQRHLVGHRSSRQPERRFFSQNCGGPFLKTINSGVFGDLIVADGIS
jgi:hypothetical protein